MKTVYLSLGSNLGERQEHLAEALRLLEEAGVTVVRRSSLYETAPQDMPNQPWFLNLAVEAQTFLFPRQLLGQLKRIEKQMGRRRTVDKGPRIIDIDILFYGTAIIRTGDLEVPHPRLAQRRFVLDPMVELAPELRHPVTRQTMLELRERVLDQIVKKCR